MHTKWLTYRVSWCNVRVKLGQSLWAGGALAKRLPLLQETDRQWEKTRQSASAVTSHIYIISLSRYRHVTLAIARRRGDETSSVGTERNKLSYRIAGQRHSPGSERRGAELSVIMFDGEEDEVAVKSRRMNGEKAPD